MPISSIQKPTNYPVFDIDIDTLSTAIGLTPGGSGTVYIYAQTIQRRTQITTNLEECGPCPFFVSFILAFALQLRKKHGKTSVRVEEVLVYILHITKTPVGRVAQSV